ncbi:MAG: phosphatidate cytidylyltransferase [Alloprevotella sp.]|nr:phosphatidate cytidylyltransferase [Alloprevotella sp.]
MNNLILRTLTGIGFVALLVGSIVYHPVSFAVLFALVAGLAVWEFGTLVNNHAEASVNRLISTIAAVYLVFAFAAYTGGMQTSEVFIPYLVAIIYLPIAELYLKRPDPLKNWAYAFAAQLYVALPFALLMTLGFINDPLSNTVGYNFLLPLSVFIFLWTSDTGAYCCGSLLHKKFPAKLFERISPNKSWVGSIGGGVLCLVAAAILNAAFPHNMTLLQWMGLGLTVCVVGTWGDLVESMLKRQLGVKDSGTALPGHGGWLDRFDSSLLAIPAAVLYMYTIHFF